MIFEYSTEKSMDRLEINATLMVEELQPFEAQHISSVLTPERTICASFNQAREVE